MKYSQLLEKIDFSFDSPLDKSKTVNVHKNPNNPEMKSALEKSSWHELRGLIIGNNIVYIWDANLAVHDYVIELLDNSADVNIKRFLIDSSNDLIPADISLTKEDYMASPMMQRMFKNPNQI